MTRPVGGAVLAAVAVVLCQEAPAAPARHAVDLDVQFRLTDLDYAPIANEPVRIVFGTDADWQASTTGPRFVTDADGTARFVAHVTLDKQPHTVPTNFADSVASGTQLTDHLLVAAEL